MKKKIICFLIVLTMITGTVLLPGCGAKIEYTGELHVLTFPNYFDPNLLYRFEDETGIMVIIDECDTNDELEEKMVKDSENCDLVCISDYVASKYIDQGKLAKINYNNIPNAVFIDKKNTNLLKKIDPNNEYTIPHFYGTYGILYNTKMIPKGEIHSWRDLWKEKYKGQIMMTDNMRDLMMVALKSRGHSENTTNEAEINQAGDDLVALKPSLANQSSNGGIKDALVNGKVAIGVVPSGEVGDAIESNQNLTYVVPVEGTEIWNDCWTIYKDSKNKENAEMFINYMLTPDIAYRNMKYTSYGTPNVGMYYKIVSVSTETDAMFPSDVTIKRCEVLVNLDDETMKLYRKNWKKFKDA